MTPGVIVARTIDKKTPLELLEADNAIRLARAAGADKFASDTLGKAVQQMAQAEKYNEKDANRKPAIMSAREAVQTAEDARLITLQRQEEARQAEERRVAAAKTAEANLRAQTEAEARRNAEINAERSAVDRAKAQSAAEQAAARADSEAQARRAAELDAQRSAALKTEADQARMAAESARAAAETARLEASREADRLAQERASIEAARAQAVAAQEAAQRDAQQARELAAKAEQERLELRARLQSQLNAVLETKQTARGLIVNMSDVLFDSGQASLKPGAREKLSKVAGILVSHPDLKLEIEGHTDSQGGDAFNQKLSENRAGAARAFLVTQGINATSVTSKGFGEAVPVATNDTAAGRQQNRRVELVISGESIETATK